MKIGYEFRPPDIEIDSARLITEDSFPILFLNKFRKDTYYNTMWTKGNIKFRNKWDCDLYMLLWQSIIS